MARKGRKIKHGYNLKHLDKWRELMAEPEPTPKPRAIVKAYAGNVNQLWTWDTLEDVKT